MRSCSPVLRLDKINAPECPKCGCNATELVGAGQRGGRPWARFACDNCDHQFSIGTIPSEPGLVNGVTYQAVNCRCPKCRAANPPVQSTQGKVRFHRCDNCGQRFKSVEQ